MLVSHISSYIMHSHSSQLSELFKFYSCHFDILPELSWVVLIFFQYFLLLCFLCAFFLLHYFKIPHVPIFFWNVNSFQLKPALRVYWFTLFGCPASSVEHFRTEASWWVRIQNNLAWSSWQHLCFLTALLYNVWLES